MNQYLQLFLKRMCNSECIPSSIRCQTLFKQLIKVCKLMHLNELEITIWSLWLDQIAWDIKDLSVDTFLIITSMQVKEYVNEEGKAMIYMKKIREDYPKIDVIYDSWVKDKAHKLNLSIIEINKLYRKYSQVIIFYNYIVAFNSKQNI